jgi:hypothetical protein
MALDRIVVGVDPCAGSERVARWAEEALGPVLRVALPAAARAGAVQGRAEVWAGRRRAVRAEAAYVADRLAGEAFRVGAEIVVVGALPDEVLERLVQVSRVPVLMAGSAPLRPVRRVAAAVGRSPSSDRVLPWARVLAEQVRGEVVPCHVVEDPARAGARRAWLTQRLRAEGLREAEPHARLTDPAPTLADALRGCDAELWVVGSAGPGCASGAVRRRLLREAAVPVLVAARHHHAPAPAARELVLAAV